MRFTPLLLFALLIIGCYPPPLTARDIDSRLLQIDRIEPYTWQMDNSKGFRIFGRVTPDMFKRGQNPNTFVVELFHGMAGWMLVQIEIGNSFHFDRLGLQEHTEGGFPEAITRFHMSDTYPKPEINICLWFHELKWVKKYIDIGDPYKFCRCQDYVKDRLCIIVHSSWYDEEEMALNEFYEECVKLDLIGGMSCVNMGEGYEVEIRKEEDSPERRKAVQAIADKYKLPIVINAKRLFKGE